MFAILAAALSIGAAYAQQPIVIKFSHVVAENTPKGKGALKFKELAEAAHQGPGQGRGLPQQPLFKDGEEMQMLQLGNVQMLAPSVSKFGPLGVREFEVFDLPYIFDDDKDLHNVTQGRIGQQLFKMLESKGIIGLAYWDNGFKQMSSNKPLQDAGGFSRSEAAHPVLQGARRPDARARRHAAGDGVLRGVPGAADRRRGRPGEHLVEHLHAEDSTRCRSTSLCPIMA